jgi:imidazolonepropionase-like amidohydrolase
VDADFLSLARKAGTIYCPTLTVRGGYVRMAEAVTSGRPPALDDPHHSVDSLTLAHIAATAGDARRLGIAGRVYRASRLDSMNTTMARNLMAVHRAGIPIAMGTDAGNPLTLHGPAVYAEMEAMQKAGLSPMDVIVASTRNGARAMGRGRDLGTIEKGKAADLLLVNSDPTRDVRALRDLRWVARGGVIRSSEEMRAAIARAH